VRWDEESYRGDAYKAYSWGADVVEVEVDTDTMEVHPLRATVVVEIGKAIHPVMAAGQVEGGTLQALAYGYLEEVKLEGGRYLNDRMATYIIPTSLDAPEMRVEIVELPYAGGPFGAKGLGELPMDGGAPALVAAIDHATGLFLERIPATPEMLLEAAEADADRLRS
jgi:CO/xanthine dehydrogenase Mo-binding subunit